MAQQLQSNPISSYMLSIPLKICTGWRVGVGVGDRVWIWGNGVGLELLSHPRYRPPTLLIVMKSEKKWKSGKKWRVFWSLIFFNFRYVMGGVGGNNNIGIKKCTTIFLWEWSSKQVGGCPKNFQKHPVERVFEKLVPNFTIFFLSKRVTLIFFGLKFFYWFFFRKKFTGIFLYKFFVQGFPLFLEQKLKGFSIEKFV